LIKVFEKSSYNMRFLKKYKAWIKIIPKKIFPIRILRFKKTKWLPFKKTPIIKRNLQLVNHNFVFLKKSSWDKQQVAYKNLLALGRFHQSRYNFVIKSKRLKLSSKNRKKAMTESFFNFELTLNILLWRLRLVSSTFEAQFFIKNGFVFINDKCITTSTLLLKKGDVITFTFPIDKKKSSFHKDSLQEILCSFIELDLYSKTIVVLKSNFSFEDSCLIIHHKYSSSLLKQ